MKVISTTEKNIAIEMSHEHALMIVALVRETCCGTVMHAFETRVGHSPKIVAQMGKELFDILEEVEVSE
ncbi:hypothetical protein ACQU0X_31770 [Pseudovibrio ascidiaceicola]|uniref:hypothetical protein n=1 Tax=Pseudovibrio ascidiaceicola TaxID=285279 RepID=UPI003D36E439